MIHSDIEFEAQSTIREIIQNFEKDESFDISLEIFIALMSSFNVVDDSIEVCC